MGLGDQVGATVPSVGAQVAEVVLECQQVESTSLETSGIAIQDLYRS